MHLVAVTGNAAFSHLQSNQHAPRARGFRFFQSFATDDLRFLHFAEAVESRFPDIYRMGIFVSIEGKLAFKPKRVAGTQTARKDTKFLARRKNLVPDSCAGFFVGG